MQTFDDLLGAVAAEPGTGRDIFDPATGELVGAAPVHTTEDLQRAVAAARAAGSGPARCGRRRCSA